MTKNLPKLGQGPTRAKIDKLKKTIATQNEETKEKDKIIEEYQNMKDKFLTDIDKIKNKLTGKPYLIGSRHS
jgi:hypothetical protein